MKKWLMGIIALFVLFCVYWAAGRTIMVNAITSEIEDLEAEGYKVDHTGLAVGGFPLQFRGSLIEPDLASPRHTEKPWSIKSETLNFQASAFNPLRWNARHRGDARLDLRGPKGERWLFDVRPFTVNIEAKAAISGKLKTFKATLFRPKAQAVIGTLPPIIAMDSGELSAAPDGQDMRVSLKLENIFLEQNTLKNLQRAFGPKIDSLNGQAIAIGLASLDHGSVEAWQRNGQLICEDWTIIWGEAEFQGGCNIIQSETGATGTIRVEVEDMSRLIKTLQSANIITSGQARTMSLATLLLPVNAEGRQEVTLNIRGGFLTLFGQKIWEF